MMLVQWRAKQRHPVRMQWMVACGLDVKPLAQLGEELIPDGGPAVPPMKIGL